MECATGVLCALAEAVVSRQKWNKNRWLGVSVVVASDGGKLVAQSS